MANEHDARYKKVFSNPRFMQELLESFVHEDWVASLDFSKATCVDKTFITAEFVKRESDLIWKVWVKDEPVYIYLLIEFQSSVDRFMALRVLRYLCEFYQYLVENKQLDSHNKLPAVFPLVLYNGDERWSAPTQIADLIDPYTGSTFLPQFRYFKIAANEFTPEFLEGLSNLVGTMFLVENLNNQELLMKVHSFSDMLKGEDQEDKELFVVWFWNYIGGKSSEIAKLVEPLKELPKMLATKLKQHDEQVFTEGETKGRQKTAWGLHNLGYELSIIAKVTQFTEAELTELFKQPEL